MAYCFLSPLQPKGTPSHKAVLLGKNYTIKNQFREERQQPLPFPITQFSKRFVKITDLGV